MFRFFGVFIPGCLFRGGGSTSIVDIAAVKDEPVSIDDRGENHGMLAVVVDNGGRSSLRTVFSFLEDVKQKWDGPFAG